MQIFVAVELRTDAECRCWPLELNFYVNRCSRLCFNKIFVAVELRTDAECRCWPLELNFYVNRCSRLCFNKNCHVLLLKCRSLSFPTYLVASVILILFYRMFYFGISKSLSVASGMVW